MPATEQTWRDNKQLHVWFGITGLAMLGTTIWMLAADHAREWKQYQRTFRDVESWTLASRIQEEDTVEFHIQQRELEQQLEAALAELFDMKLVDRFLIEAERRAQENGYNLTAVRSAQSALVAAREGNRPAADVIALRTRLTAAMQAVIDRAKLDEDNRQRDLKFKRAEFDSENSLYAISIDEGKPVVEQTRRLGIVESLRKVVDELNLQYEDAKTHRLELQISLGDMNAAEAAVKKQLDEHQSSLRRLETQLKERRNTYKKTILEMPIIDAFGRPLKIEQIWLPKLTINNNFRDVARFDRCTTCHLGIGKTAPGSAVEPGYKPAHELVLSLTTPNVVPQARWLDAQGEPVPEHDGRPLVADPRATKSVIVDAEGQPVLDEAGKPREAERVDPNTRNVYGFTLAERGLIAPGDVTIESTWPLTLAADAGLRSGDVLLMINDVKLLDRNMALRFLLGAEVNWGQPLRLTIRRGVPHPYSSHPRLDLFVGSLSPHDMGRFGCTICHEGQGSATQFKWASHTPNDPKQMQQWARDHGWFNNHHWIFPMRPQRFLESGCLKCHHEVVELNPSQRFPDDPAPQLMAGFNLIQDFGCFGCHEINGYDGPHQRRGPDLRTEPPYYAAAAQILADPALAAKPLPADLRRVADLAHEVLDHPDRAAVRERLAELIQADQRRLGEDRGEPALSATTHRMGALVGATEESPGEYRKVGPSLRHLASKVDEVWLYSWIKEPKNFRPSTKMPQFFGLWDHLVPVEQVDAQTGQPVVDDHGHPVMVESPGLELAKKYEPVEILAVTEFLLAASQPFQYLAPYEGITAEPSLERGKQQFEIRGCLACHQHEEFPQAHQNQGPNLSRLGSKLTGDKGFLWLYSWVREPNRYHARTVMPNLYLEPKTEPDGTVSDPAADITAWLLSSQGWAPQPVPRVNVKALDELALEYLRGTFTLRQSEEYLKTGIPETRVGEIKGDELELVGKADVNAKLMYVGRKTVGRLGCAGCHDIPGFEEAKPIGTGLADWGRKEPEKLAFEQILPYLTMRLGDGHGGHGINVQSLHPDTGFFVEAIMHHQREGFLWQKLREPRSFDFKKTETKSYLDRLRMPLFPLDEQQREQIMTFVLGLVAEPPAAEFIYQPDRRRDAIRHGEKVLAKYNCAACHTLEPEVWEFDYVPEETGRPDAMLPPPPTEDFAFVLDHFTPAQLAASRRTDRRGLGHARVVGYKNPEAEDEDDFGNTLIFIAPWESVAIDGHPWFAGGPEVMVAENRVTGVRPPRGGEFARLLHPVALALEQKTNPNAKASDAWGWVPPPLMREGSKVQTQWLHDFLLDPYPIRPSVILRMPKFNMSSEEASQLVNYFAAVDDVDFPYNFDPRTRADYLRARERQHPNRLDQALKVVTDGNYCVKCHLIGDFQPPGTAAALAPNLNQVHNRIRPDFLERWIANPKRLLPYTGMPVNFPMDKPASQELFPGDSHQQIEGVVDLLLNFDAFMARQHSFQDTIRLAPMPDEAAGP